MNQEDTKKQEYYQSKEFKERIHRMFIRDTIWGWGFVAWLWATYAFVLIVTLTQSEYAWGEVLIALLVGGFLVCIYNTGAIAAMVRHYRDDKDFIYTVDLRHLDEYRSLKLDLEYGKKK